MSAFEVYKKKMGMSRRIDTEARIENSKHNHDLNFETSPSYFRVPVNGEITEMIIMQTKYPEIKKLYFKTDYKPIKGSHVVFKDKNYLITKIDENSVYPTGEMKFCNNFFTIETGEKVRVQVGVDHLGRPYYEYVNETIEVPCIVEDKYYSANDNSQLPLPEGKLDIYIGYIEGENLKPNHEFTLYNKRYKIADLSYIEVFEEQGIIRIHAERRENT